MSARLLHTPYNTHAAILFERVEDKSRRIFCFSTHVTIFSAFHLGTAVACTYSGAAVLGSFDVAELYNIGVLPSDVRAPNTGRACL